jgi:hypothetical protein
VTTSTLGGSLRPLRFHREAAHFKTYLKFAIILFTIVPVFIAVPFVTTFANAG